MPFKLPFQPMPLTRMAQPFDHPEWLYEIKHDGFRALAHIRDGQCQLVSRKGHVYKRFAELNEELAAAIRVRSAVLDGEIVCLDKHGKSQFHNLMFRRSPAYFYAFDILELNGKDLRSIALIDRKRRLKRLIPPKPSALLYVDFVEGAGEELFRLVLPGGFGGHCSEMEVRSLRL